MLGTTWKYVEVVLTLGIEAENGFRAVTQKFEFRPVP